jgi:starvation-inducible DNA-binding protein
MLNQTDINIGIYETDRREVATHLAVLLADTYMLYLKTQNFHWNVTGKMFGTLHSLFEKHYREMAEAVDEIAESIRELGFHAPATFDEFQKRTAIREAVGVPKSHEMILELVIGHEVVIETSRILLEAAQVAGDSATADLAVRRIQSHEKSAWMLRSHLED